MFNRSFKNENEIFNSIYEHTDELTVRCKLIKSAKIGINYLINIEGINGGITVLLDKEGNTMLSQVKL